MAIDPKFIRAEELGIRLEIVRGLPIWEAAPVWKHQRAVDRIRASIQPRIERRSGSECIHAAGVYVQFRDGSLKRPDVSIFCREPDEEEDAITLVPEAVIEVVSKGYEAKDLEIAPSFYLSQGVKDVIVSIRPASWSSMLGRTPRCARSRRTSSTSSAVAPATCEGSGARTPAIGRMAVKELGGNACKSRQAQEKRKRRGSSG